MKKILFFINTLSGGGAEKVLINLINALDVNKYDITLISIKGGVNEKEVPSYVKYKKIIKTQNKIISKVLFKLLNSMPKRLFNKLFLSYKVDIKIAYLEGFPARVLWFDKSCPNIAFIHCDLSVNNLISPLYKNNAQCLTEYNNFNKVCFVSNQAMEGFFKTIGKLNNSQVVHNVVNLQDIFNKSMSAINISYQTQGVKLISIGRLTEQKGFLKLVDVVSELEKTYDFELWILGDGEQRQEIERKIKELDVKSIKLLGFIDNPYPYIKKADLFICSSYFEGYSTAVNESIILGIPVLTTDCAGMDEITENGKYGLIVENDSKSLRDGLEILLKSREDINILKQKISKRQNLTRLEEYNDLFTSL